MFRITKTVVVFTAYTVMFLLTEFALYGRFAELFGSGSVAALYSAAMFMNGCGYLTFPCLSRLLADEEMKKKALFFAAAAFFASAVLTESIAHPAVVVLSAFISMAAGGYLGGAALYAGAVRLRGGGLEGRAFGAATAAATLIQFPIQNYMNVPYIRLAVVAAGALLFLKMILPLPEAGEPAPAVRKEGRKRSRELIAAAVMALLLSHYYGIGDGILIKLNAEGRISVVAWPRLLYVGSILLAGFVADWKKGRYMTAATLAVASLLAVYPLYLGSGGSYEVFHAIFWLFSGFYVIYISATFMKLSVNSDFPELWAGMGRSVKQFVNCISVIPTAILLETAGPKWALYCNAAVVVAMTAFSYFTLIRGNREPKETGGEIDESAAAESQMEKLDSFAARYSLTSRECKVIEKIIEKIIVKNESVKNTAEAIGISERTCQRDITSIYEKTGAKGRNALLLLIFKK